MLETGPHISIVVPVYNSSGIVLELVRQISGAMGAMVFDYEIILVDDCSTDDSWTMIYQLGERDKRIKGLRLQNNGGQWIATLAGLANAQGQYIVTIDDDLEYDPYDIPKLYKAITTSSYRVVFGMSKEKYLKQGKSNLLSQARKKILNVFWGTGMTDSFKIFCREVVFRGDKFLPTVLLDAFMTQTMNKKDWGYEEVRFQGRYEGTSNHSLLKKIKLFFIYSKHYRFSGKGNGEALYSISERINL